MYRLVNSNIADDVADQSDIYFILHKYVYLIKREKKIQRINWYQLLPTLEKVVALVQLYDCSQPIMFKIFLYFLVKLLCNFLLKPLISA